MHKGQVKLNPRTKHPENNTMWFAVNDFPEKFKWFEFPRTRKQSGFVGVILFSDGKWYSMPQKDELSDDSVFYWIEHVD